MPEARMRCSRASPPRSGWPSFVPDPQLAEQVAATHESETRLSKAISLWEEEKRERLRLERKLAAKCREAQVMGSEWVEAAGYSQ